MDHIVRDFSIALIGAVIGGLLAGPVDRRLAAVSLWYRARTAASRAKREHIVGVLAGNPQLLSAAYLDALIGVVVVAAIFGIFLQFKNVANAAPLASGTAVPPEVVGQAWGAALLLILLAVILVIIGYFASRRISIAQEAWRRIGQANGLPKFW